VQLQNKGEVAGIILLAS